MLKYAINLLFSETIRLKNMLNDFTDIKDRMRILKIISKLEMSINILEEKNNELLLEELGKNK